MRLICDRAFGAEPARHFTAFCNLRRIEEINLANDFSLVPPEWCSSKEYLLN